MEENEVTEKEKGKEPEALPDESLDEATGGLILPAVHSGGANLAGITDGTSNTAFPGTSSSLTKTGPGTLNFADGSVKPGP